VSVIVPVKLYDILILEPLQSGIVFKTSSKELPQDEHNLAFQAAKAFLSEAKIPQGVKITLRKKIPVGTGLGGGSSDAAGTLLGMNKLFNFPLSFSRLVFIGNKLGKDVPFFLYQKPALVTGTGEQLKPLRIPSLNVLIYVPNIRIFTKWAYEEFDKKFSSLINSQKLLTNQDFYHKLIYNIEERNYYSCRNLIYNTFESLVFMKYPELLNIKLKFLSQGIYCVGLSGSGSAIFGIGCRSLFIKLKSKLDNKKEKLIFTKTLS
jgi:4-diphosphocytidyl-2-C-methyl-D-erythritol kinase